MDEFIKILSASPTGPGCLLVAFSTGELREVSFAELIESGGLWSALADPLLFAQVQVDEYGRGVEWPNGADSCADAMYARSIKPAPVRAA